MGGVIIDILKDIIIIIIVLKYLVLALGYLGCFVVTKYLKRKGINDGENELKEDKDLRNNPPQNNLVEKIINLINGYLRYSIILTGKIPSHIIRNLIYKYIYNLDMKYNVVIYGGCEFRAPYRMKIGQGTIIGNESKLDGRNGIIIGENVNLSTGVWIWTEQHDPQCPHFSCADQGESVIIEDRAWVSSRTTILPGVKIGEGAVIASGSIVTKDVEPYSIYGGIPAKKIGERNKNLLYEFNGEFIPFY